VGKERPGKDSGVADEMVRSRELAQPTVGKATRVDDKVGDPSIDGEAVCHGEGADMQGCFLTDRARDKLIGDLRDRVGVASSRFNDAVEAVKAHELAKRPEDLHWAWGMLLDVASNFVIGAAIKSLTKAKAGHLRELEQASTDAVVNGDLAASNIADARARRFRGITDDRIRTGVTTLGGLAKTTARDGMKSAFQGDTREKAQTVNYLSELQSRTDLAFQSFASKVAASATDAELVVIWDAMSIEHHGVELYKRAIVEKLQRFHASGVERVGTAQDPWEVDQRMERSVTWVQHPDGTRSLWYQERATSHGHGPEPRLTGLVPREFWEEAIGASETAFGATPTRVDSAQTRAMLGVSPSYADRMNAARVSAGKPTDDDGRQGAIHVVKIFGGQ